MQVKSSTWYARMACKFSELVLILVAIRTLFLFILQVIFWVIFWNDIYLFIYFVQEKKQNQRTEGSYSTSQNTRWLRLEL